MLTQFIWYTKMIYFNGNIKEIHYKGFAITKIYSCGGELVWQKEMPTIYRWVKTEETTCVEETPVIEYRWVKTDDTTCVEDN